MVLVFITSSSKLFPKLKFKTSFFTYRLYITLSWSNNRRTYFTGCANRCILASTKPNRVQKSEIVYKFCTNRYQVTSDKWEWRMSSNVERFFLLPFLWQVTLIIELLLHTSTITSEFYQALSMQLRLTLQWSRRIVWLHHTIFTVDTESIQHVHN